MLANQLVRLGETKDMAHPRGGLVHFVCTTDQSTCSNPAILGATGSLSTGVDVSQFVLQLGVGGTPPPVPTYIYTANCTH